MAQPIPQGFNTLTPHIIVADGVLAIELYKRAFGAQENFRLMAPDGKSLMHAQLKIGGSVLMMAGEFPPGCLSPKNRGGTSVYLHLYVPDADAAFERAVKAGCTVKMPVADTFWGDRYGIVEDPFGHQWAIATHQHDYTADQLAANAKEFMAKMGKC
jgi:uncharacterized glyoxalase superfamily protein PhnB